MDVSFVRLLSIIWRHPITAVLSFVASFAMFLAYCGFAPRLYESSALIFVERGRVADISLTRSNDQDEVRRALVNTLVKLVQSEDIIRDAINTVGGAKLYPNLAHARAAWRFAGLEEKLEDAIWFAREDGSGRRAIAFDDKVYAAVTKHTYVEADPNTDLFKITYRNADPEVTAAFTNALASSFLRRYAELTTNPLAVQVLKGQEENYDKAYDEAANSLHAFARRTDIYSIGEQRTLLLKRRDHAVSDLAETHGNIEKIESELASLRIQLASLRSRMSLPSEIFGPLATNASAPPPNNDPALLNLKLFQESSQLLVKGNSDLAGLKSLEKDRKANVELIDAELQRLGAGEAEFMRLQRHMEEAASQIDTFAKRKADAQFSNSWRSDQNLSVVQVAQSAHPPWKPVEPKIPLVLFIGLLTSFCVAASASYFAEHLRAQARSYVARNSAEEADAPAKTFNAST